MNILSQKNAILRVFRGNFFFHSVIIGPGRTREFRLAASSLGVVFWRGGSSVRSRRGKKKVGHEVLACVIWRSMRPSWVGPKGSGAPVEDDAKRPGPRWPMRPLRSCLISSGTMKRMRSVELWMMAPCPGNPLRHRMFELLYNEQTRQINHQSINQLTFYKFIQSINRP